MKPLHSLIPLAAALLLACDEGQPATQPVDLQSSIRHHDDSHDGGRDRDDRRLGPQLALLRRVTDRFHSIPSAQDAGYAAFGGCFSDPVQGGMGFHYANDALIADSAITPLRPELMVYEPLPNGELKLAAVEYIVFVDEWHAKGHAEPPRLFGREFHINPTLLAKPFYLLHVWVWKENPAGTFNDWNPRVHCPEA